MQATVSVKFLRQFVLNRYIALKNDMKNMQVEYIKIKDTFRNH